MYTFWAFLGGEAKKNAQNVGNFWETDRVIIFEKDWSKTFSCNKKNSTQQMVPKNHVMEKSKRSVDKAIIFGLIPCLTDPKIAGRRFGTF